MNQPSWAAEAQSKIRRFGYWWQAWSRVSFQSCMLASDHGPDGSRVFTLTHMTGAPCATDISSWIRAIRLPPAPAYWATRRWAGSGRARGETRPPEVESPMWATERQDVPAPVAAARAGTAPWPGEPWPGEPWPGEPWSGEPWLEAPWREARPADGPDAG